MITIHVNAPEGARVPRGRVEQAVRETLRREGISAGEVSVTFLDDTAMAELHGRHLGCPEVTDVLSFALHGNGRHPVGDIYVGHRQALRQAEEEGVDAEEELMRLAVHGTLHVLGHDHPEGPERYSCEMYRLQEDVLRGLGAGRPHGGSGS